MNISDRLISHLGDLEARQNSNFTRGKWFNIRLQPDLLAGDLLNVGVGFIDKAGRLHTRTTDDVSRLKCLYDDRVDIEDMQLLVDLISDSIDQSQYCSKLASRFSPQLSFSTPSYAAGESVEDILDTFYMRTVSLVPPQIDGAVKKKDRFRGYSTQSVISDLAKWMAENDKAAYSRIFPSSSKFSVRSTENGVISTHSLDLPIRSPGELAGGIVSAYCSAQTAQIRLLQSAMSVNTAKRHLSDERLGLFVLRPDINSGLEKSSLNRLDEAIEESVWQLHDAGVYVGVESSVDMLGAEISNWVA